MSSGLERSPDEMRRLGYRVVDMVVDHLQGIASEPVTATANRRDLEHTLRAPPSESPGSADAALALVGDTVLANIMHVDHPRFFAFVPGPGGYIGALAEFLAAGFNVFAGTWLESSGPAQVELSVVDWLARLLHLPDGSGGVFVSGGSVANLTALVAARLARLGAHDATGVVYCSDQTHASIRRAMSITGLGERRLRVLASDEAFRLDPEVLASAVAEDRRRGERPFCVIASAGTTNTGAVDPLGQLAALCRSEGLWLHVDGAYGAAAALTPAGAKALEGIGDADSVTLDPHKWWFQPFECSCVLVRDPAMLRDAFQILPEYMQILEPGVGQVNFCDYGPQLTRSFSALKLWLSLTVLGVGAFREAVAHGISLAEQAEAHLRSDPAWEVVTPAQLGIVTFRLVPSGRHESEIDQLNADVADRMVADGLAVVSTTELRGRTVLRLCTINPRTTADDITTTLDRLKELGDR